MVQKAKDINSNFNDWNTERQFCFLMSNNTMSATVINAVYDMFLLRKGNK